MRNKKTEIIKDGLHIDGYYRHYKGNIYQVIDIAIHSETKEKMVVYRQCYGNKELFVRPLYMFNEVVKTECEKTNDGEMHIKYIHRFEYMGDSLL